MVEDPQTHAVMLFCEAVRGGPTFVNALAKARSAGKADHCDQGRPVRRPAAAPPHRIPHRCRAPTPHIRRCSSRYGVIEAEDADEAVAIAGVVLTCPLPKGRRVGIITPSGGAGAWMADTLSAAGLQVPALSAEMQTKLRAVMPSYGASGNPVDVTAQGSNTGPAVMTAMEQLAGSDELDMLVLISSLASQTRVTLDATRVQATAQRAGKPMTVWTYTLPSAFGRESAAGCGLFVHSALRNVGVSLAKLAEYAEAAARSLPPDPPARDVAPLPPGMPRILPEYQAKQALAAFLPPAQERLVSTAAEAAEAAAALGFPVALKVQSADLPHKTEAGGVRLGLPDAAAVRQGYDAMLRDVMQYQPEARIDGVLVQKMAPKGHELVIGMVNDETFGPIMMLGFGGTTVELFGDVVHSPAPVDTVEAERMLRSLRSTPLLTGFRGGRPVDLTPIAQLVAQLSEAALAYRGQIAEMEFNPVILHADGSGVTIADALVTLKA